MLTASAIQTAILIALAYVLITAVLTVLTATRKHAVDVHDRVRQCMELRRRYRTGDADDKEEEINVTIE